MGEQLYNNDALGNFEAHERHTMANKNLAKLLEQLHNELSGVEAVDDRGRELLRALNADIQKLLERSEAGESDASIVERLQESINHFEDSYPALTSLISGLMNALSNVGI